MQQKQSNKEYFCDKHGQSFNGGDACPKCLRNFALVFLGLGLLLGGISSILLFILLL